MEQKIDDLFPSYENEERASGTEWQRPHRPIPLPIEINFRED